MYWKAWELAFRNFHEPAQGSGFVSPLIDAAFNQNIFFRDTCFMTMFCNVAHPLVPGICSLDNFYCKQYENTEISREINRSTGQDFTQWVNQDRAAMFSRWSWTGKPAGPAFHYLFSTVSFARDDQVCKKEFCNKNRFTALFNTRRISDLPKSNQKKCGPVAGTAVNLVTMLFAL
jgi:hypothetical protein